MSIVEIPSLEAAYDKVGVYNQDAVNGFSEQMINAMLDLSNLASASSILDAMAGNGNLTLRLYDYCIRHGFTPPHVVVLELSQVQCGFAKTQLACTPARVIWGDVLTMEDYESGESLPDEFFDRVMIKSGSHEIPLEKQLDLYRNVFRVLKPGGLFVNLGFLFDDAEEREEFRDITRLKDQLAGLHSAVANRHFLTRQELYTRLQQAGFAEIRCGMHVPYTIRTLVGVQAYFPEHAWDRVHAELQAQQAKARVLRRRGRIHFHGDSSTMICPGEITVAHRPAALS